MKSKRFLIACALLCAILLPACDARVGASEKLISTYLNIEKGSSDTAKTMDVAPYADGYLAVSLYSGAGGHLMLYRIAKDAGGAEKITAMAEGGNAQSCGYTVNMVVDEGKTIVFGYVSDASLGFNKIDVTFSDGQTASKSLTGGKGFIAVADGDLSVKDFALTGSQKDKTSGFTDYLQAGGSITRTNFTKVEAD